MVTESHASRDGATALGGAAMNKYLPPDWGDADWWRRANTIQDVGEVHARARREANRLRRLAAARRAFADRMGL